MKDKRQHTLSAWQEFLNTPIDVRLEGATHPDSAAKIIEFFHEVVSAIAAYREFLQQRGIDPNSIQTLADFQALPPTTKENYLKPNPLGTLCRDGQLESCDFIAVSSGSSGQPTFWPRFLSDEFQIATRFEQVFRDSFAAHQKRTLAVVCFPLGTWVGGMYTASCCRYLAAKGYPITVVTPGNKPAEILRVVKELAPLFEQVVLLGYPPFLKEVIDRGLASGFAWANYEIKLVMAGEVFTEQWRDLVGERVGASAPCYDSVSLYGTADAGVLGNETPLSICIRRFLASNPDAARQLFGASRLPTLVQYDPLSRYFETHEGTLLFSGDNGVPLIRYHISDEGGIITYEQMLQFLRQWDFDPLQELSSHQGRGVHALPFVYVFGRSHFVISYFGANIYPENVSVGLEQPEIRQWVTGKFVMEIEETPSGNRHFCLAVELVPGVEADEAKQAAIATSVLEQLLHLNSEFANYVPAEYQRPQVTLKPAGDPEYFPLGIKHRYTRR